MSHRDTIRRMQAATPAAAAARAEDPVRYAVAVGHARLAVAEAIRSLAHVYTSVVNGVKAPGPAHDAYVRLAGAAGAERAAEVAYKTLLHALRDSITDDGIDIYSLERALDATPEDLMGMVK